MSACWGGVPDDQDRAKVVIATCRDCGALCESENEWCDDCYRLRRKRNEELFLRALRTWWQRVGAAS